MGGEGHALLLDFPHTGQREDLKSPAVSQNWAIPTHEPMQAAHFLDELVAWPQMKMIGIGELDLTAGLL